jgi:hypothetical protein
MWEKLEVGKWGRGFGEEELIMFNENKDLGDHVVSHYFLHCHWEGKLQYAVSPHFFDKIE